MKPIAFALAATLLPLAGHAAILQTSASAGDSAAVVATCLAGSYPYASDVRGCSDGTGQVVVPGPPASLGSAAWATYASGMSSQATAGASLGTLHAFAQTSIPVGDGIGHNLQSHAYADMQDTLLASSSYGTLFNNYAYTVNISGLTTASTPIYAVPTLRADAYVQLNIRYATTGGVLVQSYWETSDTQLGGGVISGVLNNIPANTLLSIEVFIQADSGVVTAAFSQGGFAQADYSDTVQVHLDALTPGANTVGTSGYDYASAAAVPEPASAWSLAGGLAWLAWRRRSNGRGAPVPA
jgi:hypothetical protein